MSVFRNTSECRLCSADSARAANGSARACIGHVGVLQMYAMHAPPAGMIFDMTMTSRDTPTLTECAWNEHHHAPLMYPCSVGRCRSVHIGLLCNAFNICAAPIACVKDADGCWKMGKGANSHSAPMGTLLCTRVGCSRDAWAQVWCAWVGVPYSWAKVLFSECLAVLALPFKQQKSVCVFC